jgi:membrane-associated protease RseP (regulator of RpoE activity)
VSSPEFVEPPGPDGSTVGAVPSPGAGYRPRWWLHILLFVATFASTTLIGGLVWSGLPPEMVRLGLLALLVDPRVYVAGLQFSVPLITVLLCHELGHYLAARRHGLTATPPYFIPFPVPLLGIGTLGAVIRVKDPIRTKRQLLDIGAAGPIAGFVALVPFLAYGIAASEIGETPAEGAAYLEFGEPLIYQLMEALIRPGLGDNMTLWLHPTGVAAWFGVLVTLLNMLPFAQLDGGHVGYALLGRWHRRLVWPLLGGLFGLGFVWPGWWVWVAIALFLRPQHPPLWDEEVPLDPWRKLIGWTAVAIFVLCFVVEPIKIVF